MAVFGMNFIIFIPLFTNFIILNILAAEDGSKQEVIEFNPIISPTRHTTMTIGANIPINKPIPVSINVVSENCPAFSNVLLIDLKSIKIEISNIYLMT